MNTDKYIVQISTILSSAGRGGLRLHKIAMLLYNENCDLFDKGDSYEDILQWLSRYLHKQIKDRHSSIKRVRNKKTGNWLRGYYRLSSR